MYLLVHYLDGDYTTPYNYSTWLISANIYSCTSPLQIMPYNLPLILLFSLDLHHANLAP